MNTDLSKIKKKNNKKSLITKTNKQKIRTKMFPDDEYVQAHVSLTRSEVNRMSNVQCFAWSFS